MFCVDNVIDIKSHDIKNSYAYGGCV